MSLLWLKSLEFCGEGEAGPFLEKSWSSVENRIRIDDRVLVNTHGGSLSEGGTQGAGHLREAVHQLRGSAGERQSTGADVAPTPRRVIIGVDGEGRSTVSSDKPASLSFDVGLATMHQLWLTTEMPADVTHDGSKRTRPTHPSVNRQRAARCSSSASSNRTPRAPCTRRTPSTTSS
ncbi:thiolase C-terminal domain-containing protein [Frankia sp. Cas4]|uniref:thiolase C-terminal domain-containing protein n=1 Tax=Frankia sp. Cas4 TaxID=3073927 RepID=UPI003A1026EC